MMKEAHRTSENQGDGHDDGASSCISFCDKLNVLVLAIFYILWYIFPLNVVNYDFIFIFSCMNLWGIVPSLTQDVGKGKGRYNPMWTQWRNATPGGRNDEWGDNEWKGGNICDEGARP